MALFAVAQCRRADHKRAVGDGVGNAFVFRRRGEKFGGANGGAGFAKGRLEWIHDPEAGEAKVAHRSRHGANVQRIARGNQDYGKPIEFGG